MEADGRAQVCWIFADEDASTARELLTRAKGLEALGVVQNWTLTGPGLELLWSMAEPTMRAELINWIQTLRRADVAVFLCSHALFGSSAWKRALEIVTQRSRARVVPVLVGPVALPPELAGFQALPRDGEPIAARAGRDEILDEVFRGIVETFRAPVDSTLSPRPKVLQPTSAAPAGTSINEIFRLDGPPTYTFIEPPEFARLQLELRTMGTGLIVEGPSKAGKSTAIRKAMESLEVAPGDQIWWHGQRPPPLDDFARTLDGLLQASRDTWLFIDDFHHLEDERYRRELASAMKVLADLPTRHAKVTLIGINPLGNSLVQVMPDLSGRFRVLRLDIDRDWKRGTKIVELIIRGEAAANIRFKRRDEFVVAADGSFFLAQYLCNVAAVKAGILEAQREPVEIDLTPVEVITAIQGELSARFRAPMIDFAAFDGGAPSRGAGLSLLWLLARSSDGVVPVREARPRFPMLNAAFDWLLASNLSRCFREHPRLQGLLYYSAATQNLTMEDPQLKFYLRALNWEEFAAASGHGHVAVHPEDGPLWTISGVAAAAPAVAVLTGTGTIAGRAPEARCWRVLHLSDLHFATRDQPTVWYAQLAADLREQGVDQLDAAVLSGDLSDRADPAEYDAVRVFVEKLMSGFSLSARQIVLVPGNHDASWAVSEDAYRPYRKSRYPGTLAPGMYVEHPGGLIEVREDDVYRRRFEAFAGLYRAIKGVEYPLAYEDQGTVDELPELGLCFVGLNSAWETDHHFPHRASIHAEALANALLRLGAPAAGQLRVAVFHHPVNSSEDARLADPAFLQQLAVHGFELALHGHVHKADAERYRYDRVEGGRRIEIVAAGTFGAPTRQWVPGYPLEYNLLRVCPDDITVETRCRREISGAWGPDARWLQGPGKDPLPRYVIERRDAT
jgi:3',5'-cyclic AMP phosphodiesterase CpdA